MDRRIVINILSSADKVEGQGVGSVCLEQVSLAKEDASDLFTVEVDSGKKADIIHFRTTNPRNYLKMRNNRNANICYVYFLPDALNGSIQLPKVLSSVLKRHVISLYKTADYLTVVNPILVEELEKCGIARKKIVYIPNYASRGQFHVRLMEQYGAIYEQCGIRADDFVVIGVGQVQTRKGIPDFVDTAKELPDVHFAWCGGFLFGKITDGYEEPREVVEDPSANVQLPGVIPRSDMSDTYNMVNVLFMPSYNELFPVAILEAASLHRPMILCSLELYEGALPEKYQITDDNDSSTELIRRLHEDPAYYMRCTADSAYISEYYSREDVLNI